jgi:histidinol phosphatase-like enzyme
MLDLHGALPTPDEIRERSRTDPRFLLPDAQFRHERLLEPPTTEEGFVAVETRQFVRRPTAGESRAVVLDFDDLVGSGAPVLRSEDVAVAQSRRDVLARYQREGWLLFIHAWRPQVERQQSTLADVDATFARMRELLGGVDIACCPHDAGPPVCWCRKPIPGSILAFARRRGVVLEQSIVVGSSAADRTMAERIGARFEVSDDFFHS